MSSFEKAKEAAREITDLFGTPHKTAVVLGSGWGDAAQQIGEIKGEVETDKVTGFLPPVVKGHGGRILSVEPESAKDSSDRVLIFKGRTHLYEGHPVSAVVHGIRTAAYAGCEAVILTNAAGGINPDYGVGQPVLISDHINLTGTSPMYGEIPPEDYNVQFVDLTEAYSKRLRQLAKETDSSLAEGVYAGFLGPHYETPAEIQMVRTMGADLAGMSTVLECIAARHMQMEVMGVSLVTNAAAGISDKELDHKEVLEAGKTSGEKVVNLLKGVIGLL